MNIGDLAATCGVVSSDRAKEVADVHAVKISSFEEGLGQVMHVGQSFRTRKAIPGTTVQVHEHSSRWLCPGPPYVKFFLSSLSASRRHHPCAMRVDSWDTALRFDAQASKTRRQLVASARRRRPPRPVALTVVQPRDHERTLARNPREGRQARSGIIHVGVFLRLSSDLNLFHGTPPSENRTKIQLMPTWTDNRGSGATLKKLMTTRYPVSAVLALRPPQAHGKQ